MQLPHVFIAFFMRDQAFPHVFIAVWHPLGFLLGAHWDLLGLLLGMLEGLWSFLGILWGQNGARNTKMRVSKSILAQVEVARGSQRVSMGRFGEDVHHLFCAIWYIGIFFARKVCASWLQRRIAVAFLHVLDVVKAAPQARPKTT